MEHRKCRHTYRETYEWLEINNLFDQHCTLKTFIKTLHCSVAIPCGGRRSSVFVWVGGGAAGNSMISLGIKLK
jgi:hypothetical protein